MGAEGEAQAVEILHEVNPEMGEGLMLAAWLDPHDTDSRERLSQLVCAFIYSSDFVYLSLLCSYGWLWTVYLLTVFWSCLSILAL